MGTVKEICWSTKFRKQQKLAKKAKSRDEHTQKCIDEHSHDLDDSGSMNQNTEPSKIPRRIRMSKAMKHKFKTENNEKSQPQDGSRTELKRGSELSQVSVILTAQNSELEVHCSKEVKEVHCPKTCVDPQCAICCPKKQEEVQTNCCTKGKCKDKEKKPEACCGKRKPVKCKRARASSSVSAINQSLKVNCCACGRVLVDYFNEVIRLLSCKCDTKVNEIFCELVDVAGCLCSDCLTLLKKLVCYLQYGLSNLQRKCGH